MEGGRQNNLDGSGRSDPGRGSGPMVTRRRGRRRRRCRRWPPVVEREPEEAERRCEILEHSERIPWRPAAT